MSLRGIWNSLFWSRRDTVCIAGKGKGYSIEIQIDERSASAIIITRALSGNHARSRKDDCPTFIMAQNNFPLPLGTYETKGTSGSLEILRSRKVFSDCARVTPLANNASSCASNGPALSNTFTPSPKRSIRSPVCLLNGDLQGGCYIGIQYIKRLIFLTRGPSKVR